MRKNARLRKAHRIAILIGLLAIGYFMKDRLIGQPTEGLLIDAGIGFDVETADADKVDYTTSVSSYVLTENSVTSAVYASSAPNFPQIREVRQRGLNKRFIAGFEKVYVISEDYARYGIRNMLDILFKDQFINDNGYVVVCGGKAQEIMKQEIPGYPSSVDFIEGMIDVGYTNNFFSKKYALIDVFKFVGSEGVNGVLPYIELKDGRIQVTGMALFSQDKMVEKLDMEETRMLNILRENISNGILTIQKSPKKYIGFECVKKRKVKCDREDDRYKFTVDLNLTGNIIANFLYGDIMYEVDVNNRFEQDMADKVQKECIGFLHRMQHEYGIDMLNLGETAAAKYGRHTGTDWDKVVSDSGIEVNVRVKVNENGRGNY